MVILQPQTASSNEHSDSVKLILAIQLCIEASYYFIINSHGSHDGRRVSGKVRIVSLGMNQFSVDLLESLCILVVGNDQISECFTTKATISVLQVSHNDVKHSRCFHNHVLLKQADMVGLRILVWQDYFVPVFQAQRTDHDEHWLEKHSLAKIRHDLQEACPGPKTPPKLKVPELFITGLARTGFTWHFSRVPCGVFIFPPSGRSSTIQVFVIRAVGHVTWWWFLPVLFSINLILLFHRVRARSITGWSIWQRIFGSSHSFLRDGS